MASSSPQAPVASYNSVQPYRMHISQKYLELTRQKLELTRLPRDPRNTQQRDNAGVAKSDLEPLIDFWMSGYDWRAQESFYNDTLPQFRVPVNGTRLHFVHKRSNAPNAIPLLFVHGWPESFVTVAKVIDALTNPISTPPRGSEDVQAFHVIVPSIPGFGFSDPIPEAANNMTATGEIFNTLMMGLGYHQYVAHGSGWGFKICRILSLTHPNNCIAIHTVNPEVPAPRFEKSPLAWLRYRWAKLIMAIARRSSFGYSPEELCNPYIPFDSMGLSPGITPPITPGAIRIPSERPQTMAYALCDSPSGLLAHMLDAIRPPPISSPTTSPPQSPETLRVPRTGLSPASPQSYGTSTPQGRSPRSQGSSPPQHLELNDISTAWTPTALINWTMLYWLPGPEVALRWLANSAMLVPTLWASYSAVPLGITHFQDPLPPDVNEAHPTSPPQWAEAYHRIATVRRRNGRVRFPAWERPAELVVDIREFVGMLGLTTPTGGYAVTNGV